LWEALTGKENSLKETYDKLTRAVDQARTALVSDFPNLKIDGLGTGRDPAVQLEQHAVELESRRQSTQTELLRLEEQIKNLKGQIERATEMRSQMELHKSQAAVARDLALALRGDQFIAFIQAEAYHRTRHPCRENSSLNKNTLNSGAEPTVTAADECPPSTTPSTTGVQRLDDRPQGLRQWEALATRSLHANAHISLSPSRVRLSESHHCSRRKPGKKQIAQDSVVATIIFGLEHLSGIIKTIMVALEETIIMPLVVTEQGTIRIKGSRVSLDSVIHHFKLGATAEQIVQSFPSLSLGDVYSSIAYYLTHRPEIETYLEQQKVAADNLQHQLESNPDYQAEIGELRSRILHRWTVAQENGEATPTA
jgi:uncharacterized protein (DUF433 family)